MCSKERLSIAPNPDRIMTMPTSMQIPPSTAKGAEIKKMRAPEGSLPTSLAIEIKQQTAKRPRRRKTMPRCFRFERFALATDLAPSKEPDSLSGFTSGVLATSDIDDSGKKTKRILKNWWQGPVAESLLRAAGAPLLNRGARGVAVRTVHTTVAFLRFQQLAAAFAFIEELARVRRHQFSLGVPALWAGDCRMQFHERIRVKLVTGRYGSIAVILAQTTRPAAFG
jgi:hypothetical protein